MNPPWQDLEKVIEKIIHDQATGILLVPVWPDAPWWSQLEKLTVAAWDLPRDVPLFQTEDKVILKQRFWTTRAVLIHEGLKLQTSNKKRLRHLSAEAQEVLGEDAELSKTLSLLKTSEVKPEQAEIIDAETKKLIQEFPEVFQAPEGLPPLVLIGLLIIYIYMRKASRKDSDRSDWHLKGRKCWMSLFKNSNEKD